MNDSKMPCRITDGPQPDDHDIEIDTHWEPETLPDEEAVRLALIRHKDTGDALLESFEEVLAGDVDGWEFESALVAGDLIELIPMLQAWRKEYMKAAWYYLEHPNNRAMREIGECALARRQAG